jgi:FMN hydrolase / 5-amino-6-(5-phospho-D-ribitylamino)uracil phosphatase
MAIIPLDHRPKAVLFDLDDTLCDYAAAREARLRIAFTRYATGGEHGEGIDLEHMIVASIQLHPHGADHFGELFSRFGVDDPTRASAAADWYRTNRFHGLKLFPGVDEVFRIVRDGLSRRAPTSTQPLGIVTNGPAEVQRAKLDLLEIEGLVDFAVVSEEFGVAKPDPRIFHEALRRAGVDASEAVFVGDSAEFDMVGARAAGIPSVWVNRNDVAWTESGPPPTREIRSLDDLPQVLGFER